MLSICKCSLPGFFHPRVLPTANIPKHLPAFPNQSFSPNADDRHICTGFLLTSQSVSGEAAWFPLCNHPEANIKKL